MRLVTWNVFHGRSPEDGRVDAERLADAVAGLDADVLALQEVDRGQPRSGMLDVTTLAAAATGAADARFVPTVVGDPAGEWRAATDEDLDVDAFGYGIALVSRHPVRAWHLLRLAPAPLVRAPIPVPGQRRVLWLRGLPGPRVLLGDLNLPGAAVGRLTGARLLARQATYPPSRPVWQVDHALGDGELPPVVASGAPRQPVSDHAPVVVDLAEPLG